MNKVPEGRERRLIYYTTYAPRWAERAEALNVSPDLAADLQAATLAANEAALAQRVARDAARSATGRYNLAIKEMSRLGAIVKSQIHATAAAEGPGIYPLASLTPPANKSPIAAPRTPASFTVRLLATGALQIAWKCRNPAGAVGTQYRVSRRIPRITPTGTTPGEPEHLGITGKKTFTDDTLPQGTANVTYIVQAIRSTRVGPVAEFPVTLGGGRWARNTFTPRRAA